MLKPNPSSTILYSSASEMESHIVRFIMAEKNIEREIANLKTQEAQYFVA
jgi:RNA polymerase-associated protein